MSKKKGDQVLQLEIDSTDQYNDIISKEGLVVMDVYQPWCGPAKQFETIFKKVKVDLSDPLLFFAIANADKIPELENYRGRCEPCFLFYASKCLVAVVRGANAPVIIKTITEQLAQEHKVLAGEAQRKTITDNFVAQQKLEAEAENTKKTVENIMTATTPITISILKPDIVSNNKQEEVIAKIVEKGYTIVEQKEITFSEEMVAEFYEHKKDTEVYDELVKYMTSGPSIILALTKPDNAEDVINTWREDVGPTDLEKAKEKPDSFRAQYATTNLMNSIHGSDSHEAASRELAYFFPKGVGKSNEKTNRTLALIRPSALAGNKDNILNRIKEKGFKIAMAKTVQLDKESAEEFYAEQKGKPFFNDLVNEMTSGPMMVLCLVKDDAVTAWREILGPKEKENVKDAAGTMRQEFDVTEVPVNALHGASTAEQAEKELSKFFPMEQTIALLKPGMTPENREEIKKRIEDSGFLIAAKKSETLTEEIAKEMYKYSADKPHYDDLVKLMTSGETEILVLSRENAIDGWREEIGDVNPSNAKETNPNSLRAIYGVDTLNNGLHGATTKDQAELELNLFFSGAKFNEKGEFI